MLSMGHNAGFHLRKHTHRIARNRFAALYKNKKRKSARVKWTSVMKRYEMPFFILIFQVLNPVAFDFRAKLNIKRTPFPFACYRGDQGE